MSGLARNPSALQSILTGVQPAARIVRERRLRRLVNLLRDEGQEVCYHPDVPLWIPRELAFKFDVLPKDAITNAPDRLVLLSDPRARLSSRRTDEEVLRDYWRLLVRAAIIDAVGPIQLEGLVGNVAAAEARFVLAEDQLIPPRATEETASKTFAGVVGDRLVFAPHTLPWIFPCLPDAQALIETSLRTPLASLADSLRPVGAAEVGPIPVEVETDLDEDIVPFDLDDGLSGKAAALTRRARAAASSGNFVRAALYRTRAARSLSGTERAAAEAAARSALHDGLVSRLGAILGWNYKTARIWTQALTPLLAPAANGIWPRAARALYDLQKIPSDLGNDLYTIDPAGWVSSLGRRSVRRSLRRARSTILLRHLTSASNQLARMRLVATSDRDRLQALIRVELTKAEAAVRADITPIFFRALDAADLRPANVLEQISRDKLVSELSDRVCEKGFLRFADLRDAVARNQLKMPDLYGPIECLRGDALLRADAILADELHGVYRRAEVYLRWIQRLTAAAFGTRVGRRLSQFVVLPFGGGVMTVEFAKYVAIEGKHLRDWLFGQNPVPRAAADDPFEAEATTPFDLPISVETVETVQHEPVLGSMSVTIALILGVFYLALLHIRPFRQIIWAGLKASGRLVRKVLIDLPIEVWHSPPVRSIRRHPVSRFVSRQFGTGLVIGCMIGALYLVIGYRPQEATWAAVIVAAAVSFAIATPAGQELEDQFLESVARTWRRLRVNLLPGLISSIVWTFRWLAGIVERTLYSVDELFRFRKGQSNRLLFLKVGFAFLWFPVAYMTRFAFYLLLEPQINPLKHFPVVTVSHKLLLPLVPGVSSATGLNEGTVFLLIACVPGVFGFIAWELKENWRLYAANRSERIPPAILGHHGETMRGLLRPGFHSGTVPKAYGRIRREIRDAELAVRPAVIGKWELEIEQIAASIHAAIGRELIPLLTLANGWTGSKPTVGKVRVGVQSVRVEIGLAGVAAPNLCVSFVHGDGLILANIDDPGWIAHITPQQQQVLGVALGVLGELFAATWRVPADARFASLYSELHPRSWEERVRYWQNISTRNTK